MAYHHNRTSVIGVTKHLYNWSRFMVVTDCAVDGTSHTD